MTDLLNEGSKALWVNYWSVSRVLLMDGHLALEIQNFFFFLIRPDLSLEDGIIWYNLTIKSLRGIIGVILSVIWYSAH